MLGSMAALTLVAAGGYLYSSVIAPRIAPAQTSHSEIEYLHYPEKDPKVGDGIALPAVDVFGRELPKFDGDVLLVWAGSCQACTLNSVSPQTIDGSAYSAIVAFFAEDESVVRKSFGEPTKGWYVCSDNTGHWRESLNASWSPRYYLLSSDAKLKRLQESWRSIPDFVRFK